MNKLYRKLIGIIAIFSFFVSIGVPDAFASPGDLDPSFGVGGKVVTTHTGIRHYLQDSALQSDGKLVVTGQQMFSSGNSNFFTARYNSDGVLDQSFGVDGEVVTVFENFNSFSKSVVIQPEGKIIVGGYLYEAGQEYFALVRYNSDGSIDTNFGDNGKVITNIEVSARIADLMILSNGQLLAVGTSTFYYNNGTISGFAMVQYNPDGTLATNFGVAGKVTTEFTGQAYASVEMLDGKIVIGGTGLGFTLTRYNPNGSLDGTFDGDGIWRGSQFTPDGNYFPLAGNSSISSLILQPDGKLIAGGIIYKRFNPNLGYPDFGIARFNTDGSVDTTFGLGGWINTDFGYIYDNIQGLVIQPDGKLVAVGQTNDFSSGGFALARYNTNGNLDSSFGVEGKIVTLFPNYQYARAENVLIQPDAKLILTGIVWTGSGFDSDFALTRYLVTANQPPVPNSGQDQNVNEGQIVSFDGSGSTDPDGQSDIASYVWDFGDGTEGNGQTTSHTYLDNGVYTASLTVTDTAGESNSDTAIIAVNNVSPLVGVITAPSAPVQLGSLVNASANFTDAGILDTHTASFDWGDGVISQGIITESSGLGSVSGNHTYSATGVYTIALTISDNQSGFGTSTYNYVVVYDSSANSAFVTGAGKISYNGQQARFGFNSKYQPEATNPFGQTKFVIPNIFNFESTSYDWLVVTGSKSRFKGSGTVDGTGNYDFILTGNDQPDKLRLKIWDKVTGTIFYDNQPGDSDNADASTAIDLGNIVIHN